MSQFGEFRPSCAHRAEGQDRSGPAMGEVVPIRTSLAQIDQGLVVSKGPPGMSFRQRDVRSPVLCDASFGEPINAVADRLKM